MNVQPQDSAPSTEPTNSGSVDIFGRLENFGELPVIPASEFIASWNYLEDNTALSTLAGGLSHA